MSAKNPRSPHSWIEGPLICAAVGGFPEIALDFNTVIAFSPPPPATAKSVHPTPASSSLPFK